MALEHSSGVTALSEPHFLSLPRELRDEIYQLCLPDPPVIDIASGNHPEWLLTSKQVFFEAAPMVYDHVCFYKSTEYKITALGTPLSLIEELLANYVSSTRNSPVARHTSKQVKQMISYVAVDIHLDMTVDQVKWLGEHYFAGLDELTNLKALYISLNPRPSVQHNYLFRRALASADLRIFEVVLLVKPFKTLLDRAFNGCKIHWSIPENIRSAASSGNLGLGRTGRNFLEITDFMREVNQAAAAAT